LTDHKKAKTWFSDVLLSYLQSGLLPVVYGDVLSDVSQGCTIWSTDTVFSFLARQLPTLGYEINAIVHVTEAGGVWIDSQQVTADSLQQKEIYKVITPSMKEQVKASMTDTKGFDVTGGMWHKISEALDLVHRGVSTQIVSGLKPNVVYNTLRGDTTIGTRITK
jgi:isopentenyl phosphate kinase